MEAVAVEVDLAVAVEVDLAVAVEVDSVVVEEDEAVAVAVEVRINVSGVVQPFCGGDQKSVKSRGKKPPLSFKYKCHALSFGEKT